MSPPSQNSYLLSTPHVQVLSGGWLLSPVLHPFPPCDPGLTSFLQARPLVGAAGNP